MERQELISVIVVTYNSEKTILYTLHSITEQTYKNIEIVVSDDCSKDKTLEFVQSYAQTHGNVFIVPGVKNCGVPANINKGIRAAHGRFFRIIAGDDLLEPSAIEVYWKNYEENVILISDFTPFGDKDEKKMSKLKDYFSQMHFFYDLSQKKQKKILAKYLPICTPGMGLLNLGLLERVGWFTEKYRYMEDYPFFLKCVNNGISFRYLNEKLVKYRISKDSLSGSFNKKSYTSSRQFFFEERSKYLLKNLQIAAFIKNIEYYMKYDILIKFDKV
jgi:Glycosyltransferases involved in cell wall biogenesis